MGNTQIICENHNPGIQRAQASLRHDQADIWLASISSYLPAINELIPSLSGDEMIKADQYHQLKDTRSFIIRRGILRNLLAKYANCKAHEIEFTAGSNKKPVIRYPRIPIHFNVSHSNDLVLIAFSKTEVGIDVERIKDDFPYYDVLGHAFSLEEASLIKNSSNPRKLFYRLWTRKEAILKATSKGLDDHLAFIPCTDGPHEINAELLETQARFTVRSFSPDDLHEATIAHQTGLQTRLMECEAEYLFGGP